MLGGPDVGRWGDRKYGGYLVGIGILVIAEGVIIPALFGPGPILTLSWVLLGVGLIIVGVVLFRSAPKDEEDE